MGHLVEFLKQSDLMFWLAISLILSNFIMICGLFSEFNNFISKAINVSAVEASYYVIYYAVLAGIIQLLVGCILGNYGYYIQAMLIGSFITIISSIVFIDIFGKEQKNLII